jgi:hypothetical protein
MDTSTDVEKLDSPSQEVTVDHGPVAEPCRGVAQILADDAAKPPQTLTETQFRALRRQYFTVRHGRCQPCGHRFDVITEPRTNCEHCWFHWLNEHGELIQTADRAYQEQGERFLTAMRGRKFTKMFLRFMSTLARLKAEEEKKNAVQNQTGSQPADAALEISPP